MDDLEKTIPPPESDNSDEQKPFLKPKAKRVISEERRKEMSERMRRINQERIDKARAARKGELDLKEQRKIAELERIRERKELTDVSIRDSLKSREKLAREQPVAEAKPTPVKEVKAKPEKKPKKAPVVVYESESESDDYENGENDDGEESEEEVLIVKKKKTAKPEVLKPKPKPPKAPAEPVAPPKPVIRFI
jgi:hypothetical protein